MLGRSAVLALTALFAVACSETGLPVGDAGEPGDATVRADARPRDVGPRPDAREDPVDATSLDADASPDDAEPRDIGAPSADAGPARPGAACETAGAWTDGHFLSGTTTISESRAQLSCASMGSSASAPEVWWATSLEAGAHVVLRLATDRWDGVLAARTATCATRVEACSDEPTALELPAVLGPLFVAVDGFSNERGAYALALDRSPPLDVPQASFDCAEAEALPLPAATTGHVFGALPVTAPACALGPAVHYALDLAARTSIVLRVVPTAGQDYDVAVLDGCGGAVLACGDVRARGVSEVLGPIEVGPGRVIIAVGARADRPVLGSFALSVAAAPACTRDADCALELRCGDHLACVPRAASAVTTAAPAPIPDGAGGVDVPLDWSGPVGRAARVRARVVLAHPYPEDLVVELVSPPRPGGAAPIRVRLRDRSDAPLDVTYGADRPAEGPGALDDFLLVPDATGTWRLHVEDRAAGDQGVVLGFALEVESE